MDPLYIALKSEHHNINKKIITPFHSNYSHNFEGKNDKSNTKVKMDDQSKKVKMECC